MKTLTLTRLTLLVHAACFAYGLIIMLSSLHSFQSENLFNFNIINTLILSSALNIDLHFLIYLVYSSSIFILSGTLFFLSKNKSITLAIATLATGSIWSSFLLLHGGIAIGLTQQVIGISSLNPLTNGQVWHTFEVMLNIAAKGNEIIGAIWVLLVALLLPSNNVSLKVTKLITSLIVVISACAYFERSELFSSLFDLLLILWFLCMYFSFPYAYKYWKSNS